MFNAFADAEENPQLPGSEWDYDFEEQGGNTEVRITIFNESFERMERMLAMGFQQGFTATLANLEVVLNKLSAK